MSNLSIQLITCYAHLHYQIDVSMLILNKRTDGLMMLCRAGRTDRFFNCCDLLPQKINDVRERLVKKCRSIMRYDTNPDYSSVMELLFELRDIITPTDYEGWRLLRAKLLLKLNNGVIDYAEVFARNRKPDLANHLYSEFSGTAGMPIFTRFNKALTASNTAAAALQMTLSSLPAASPQRQ